MRHLLQTAFDFWSAGQGDVLQSEKSAKNASPGDVVANSGSNLPLAPVDIGNGAIKNAVDAASPGPLSSLGRLQRHPQANREARLGDTTVAYLFRRAQRRSIGFTVTSDGLVVSAPQRVPLYEVDAALQDKAGWIVRKLGEMAQRQVSVDQARILWGDGAVLPYLGEPLTVCLAPRPLGAPRSTAVLETDAHGVRRLHLPLPVAAPGDAVAQAVRAWWVRQARTHFESRLQAHAALLGVQWRQLGLSNAHTRWGSASSSGQIRLNWRLLHCRPEVVDYVVVHELSHLRHMDHSPRFWATVASVLPGYQALRAELKSVHVPRWD